MSETGDPPAPATRPPARTSWHQDVGQDGQARQDEGEGLGEASPDEGDGEDGDQLGREVYGPKDELDHVDVDVKVLQVHGQPVVGKAGGEPGPGRGEVGKSHKQRGLGWATGVAHHVLAHGMQPGNLCPFLELVSTKRPRLT